MPLRHTTWALMLKKKLLSNLLGSENLQPTNLRSYINTWEDVLHISGCNAKEFEPRPGEADDELAYRQCKLIALIYNNGKIPGLNEARYFPYHKIIDNKNHPSGFGLAYFVYDVWIAHSTVGVRLCFLNSDDAIDAGKKFISIYERLKIY